MKDLIQRGLIGLLDELGRCADGEKRQGKAIEGSNRGMLLPGAFFPSVAGENELTRPNSESARTTLPAFRLRRGTRRASLRQPFPKALRAPQSARVTIGANRISALTTIGRPSAKTRTGRKAWQVALTNLFRYARADRDENGFRLGGVSSRAAVARASNLGTMLAINPILALSVLVHFVTAIGAGAKGCMTSG